MLTIACVQVGNYQKRGSEYVNNLHRACRNHIAVPFGFACLTDDPEGLHHDIRIIEKPSNAWGWWCKLALFKQGTFAGRVLYLDLDTLLLDNLDDLARYDGPLACLGCARANRMFWSGVLAWEAGKYDFIWTEWLRAGQPILGGDDEWMERITHSRAVRLQRQFKGFYSYNFHKCQNAVPGDARLIYFGGKPKPHDASYWAREAWASGGKDLKTSPPLMPLSLTERLARKRAEKSL